MSFLDPARSPLRAPEDGNGGGGGGNPTPNPATEPSPSMDQLLEKLTNAFSAKIDSAMGQLRKEVGDQTAGLNTRLTTVLGDLAEAAGSGGFSPPVAAVPTPVPSQPASSASPSNAAPMPADDRPVLEQIALKRRVSEAEAANNAMKQLLENTQREMRATKIEAAISQGMAGKPWASDRVIDMVSRQMASQAEIDSDGRVKIGGVDPKKHIELFWEAERWAQPAPVNAGSGASGGQRRPDGSVDLSSYNPATAGPDDLKKLLEQTRRQFGV